MLQDAQVPQHTTRDACSRYHTLADANSPLHTNGNFSVQKRPHTIIKDIKYYFHLHELCHSSAVPINGI